MLTSFVICDAISFFITRICQKIRKIDENSSYWRRKSSYFLNDMRNLNEIFRKDVLLIILKVTKNRGITLPLKDRFLENHKGGRSNSAPLSRLRVNYRRFLNHWERKSQTYALILHSNLFYDHSWFSFNRNQFTW